MFKLCVLLAVTSIVSGCSEPLPPPAKAAARIDLSEGTCLVANQGALPDDNQVRLNLRDNVTDLGSFPYAVDGEGGGAVGCTVTETATGSFSISAEATSGAQYFAINGTIAAGVGTGTITWYDHVKQTAPLQSSACNLTLRQSTAGGGGALVSFECTGLVSTQQPTAFCTGKGTFVLDRCDK
jgi:hypothetical protein